VWFITAREGALSAEVRRVAARAAGAARAAADDKAALLEQVRRHGVVVGFGAIRYRGVFAD
jgi:hypothetical protein